jgi:hypothetical protein
MDEFLDGILSQMDPREVESLVANWMGPQEEEREVANAYPGYFYPEEFQ